MELGVREWMILVGVLLILAVLLDAYRRFRNEHSNPIRISKAALGTNGVAAKEPAEDFNPELPGGKARVIIRERSEQAVVEPAANWQPDPPEPDMTPQYASDSLTDSYVEDLFMGSLEEFDMTPVVAREQPRAQKPHIAPVRSSNASTTKTSAKGNEIKKSAFQEERRVVRKEFFTPEAPAAHHEEPVAHRDTRLAARTPAAAIDRQFADKEEPEPQPVRAVEQAGRAQDNAPRPERQMPEQVLVIHVIPRSDSGFDGADLLHVLLACNLRHGEMQIFHRYEQSKGSGSVQFSLANMVEPGTFDLNRITSATVAGVSLFISLPGPANAAAAFNNMVETARYIAKHLDGEIRDGSRSAMSPQTLEHNRQVIQDFERQQLVRRA